MSKRILFVFCLVYFELEGFSSKPIGDSSFIEGINFQYKEDQWTCGDVECPAGTFGCKISIKTQSENRKELFQAFNCIDEAKNVVLGAGDKIDLATDRVIDIDIETFVGAESLYSTGYGMGGNENAKGIIAPDSLSDLKESARRNMHSVEASNSSQN